MNTSQQDIHKATLDSSQNSTWHS